MCSSDLYLDQRENRLRVAAHAGGRHVLDAFAYTAGFACHALVAGARRAVCLESSPEAISGAQENFKLNNVADRVEIVAGNAFDELRRLDRSGERFGLVVLDPPALIKSRGQLAGGARAYREINRTAMALLAEGGTLITSSCSHHLEDPLFRQVLLESARSARRPFRVLAWLAEAPDHPQLLAVPETHYLKCAVLQAI